MGEDGPVEAKSGGVTRTLKGLLARCASGGIGVGVFLAFYLVGVGAQGLGAAEAAVLAASLLGGCGPDLGMPGASASRLFGRRGTHAALWAGRFGYDGAPTHGLLGALVGTVFVGGPAAVTLGPGAALAPALAFALAYLLHLGADASLGGHRIRLLWPLEEGGRAGGSKKGKAAKAPAAGSERKKKRPPRPRGGRGPVGGADGAGPPPEKRRRRRRPAGPDGGPARGQASGRTDAGGALREGTRGRARPPGAPPSRGGRPGGAAEDGDKKFGREE